MKGGIPLRALTKVSLVYRYWHTKHCHLRNQNTDSAMDVNKKWALWSWAGCGIGTLPVIDSEKVTVRRDVRVGDERPKWLNVTSQLEEREAGRPSRVPDRDVTSHQQWKSNSEERCPSGWRSTPGKCVYGNPVSRVRIPLSPPASLVSAERLRRGLLILQEFSNLQYITANISPSHRTKFKNIIWKYSKVSNRNFASSVWNLLLLCAAKKQFYSELSTCIL